MFWAWAWSIQIGTWRRPEGSLSSTIGLRLAASRAIPATPISTMVLTHGPSMIMAIGEGWEMFTGLIQAVGSLRPWGPWPWGTASPSTGSA
jgi:hypothetical protein